MVETKSEPEERYFQLSSQAVCGSYSPKTLKFKGLIDGLTMTVLIGTCNTYNILHPRITNYLKIPIKPIPNLSVIVGNGSHLQCLGICPKFPITLQNYLFFIPFYLLPTE